MMNIKLLAENRKAVAARLAEIGRVLMSDMLEKLTYITDAVDAEATTKAREEETAKALEEYRKNARPATEEELDETRAAFGKGKTVVNIITGQKYHL